MRGYPNLASLVAAEISSTDVGEMFISRRGHSAGAPLNFKNAWLGGPLVHLVRNVEQFECPGPFPDTSAVARENAQAAANAIGQFDFACQVASLTRAQILAGLAGR